MNWPNLLSSLASGLLGALLGAGVTMWAQWRENRKLTALQLIRDIEQKASLTRVSPSAPLQDEIVAFYTTRGGTLSPQANSYLDYLTGLEFLLYASDRGFIDLEPARFWLRDHLQADSDLKSFITQLRDGTGSTATFEHLLRHHSRELRRKS